jgi:Lar family restriction alleviation protein
MQVDKPVELKPCPFCGGEAEIVGGPEDWHPTMLDPDSGGDPYSIFCKTCGGGHLMVGDDIEKVYELWNRRAGEQELPNA